MHMFSISSSHMIINLHNNPLQTLSLCTRSPKTCVAISRAAQTKSPKRLPPKQPQSNRKTAPTAISDPSPGPRKTRAGDTETLHKPFTRTDIPASLNSTPPFSSWPNYKIQWSTVYTFPSFYTLWVDKVFNVDDGGDDEVLNRFACMDTDASRQTTVIDLFWFFHYLVSEAEVSSLSSKIFMFYWSQEGNPFPLHLLFLCLMYLTCFFVVVFFLCIAPFGYSCFVFFLSPFCSIFIQKQKKFIKIWLDRFTLRDALVLRYDM